MEPTKPKVKRSSISSLKRWPPVSIRKSQCALRDWFVSLIDREKVPHHPPPATTANDFVTTQKSQKCTVVLFMREYGCFQMVTFETEYLLFETFAFIRESTDSLLEPTNQLPA